MDNALSFPEGFLWGTATAAHQIEGGNYNSDWWRFEHAPGTPCFEPSGDACDSWNRYEEDLDIVADLGLNSFRFSLEWARIEPAKGEFSHVALNHYLDVIEACHARNIVPVVTLHHFTLPLWVADEGGFESPHIVEWMGRYAAKVGEHLGARIGIACTINEPNIVAFMGWQMGVFPPGTAATKRWEEINVVMRDCHKAMRDALVAGPGNYPVGLTLSMGDNIALPGGEEHRDRWEREMEDLYLEACRGDDFIGVQCYSKGLFGPDGYIQDEDIERTDMGYAFWPECVEATVRHAARVAQVPIYVTENGIGTTKDEDRIRYLSAAIRGLHNTIADGIDVRGYCQWSLLDNFEWAYGYRMQFGIVEVNRLTFERTLKPSASWYATVARSGIIQ